MTNNIEKNKEGGIFTVLRRALPIIAGVLSLLGVGLVLYYIIGPSQYYMTGDCTDSLLWSQATYESGKLVSPDFHYAAVIPFGGNLIFLPFIAIFGYGITAQICGLALFAVLLFAAIVYLARGLGYKWYTAGAMLAVTVLVLSSSAKLREIMWEHIFYYNLGILFFALGMGLAVRIFREGGFIDRGKKRVGDFLTIGVLSVFAMLAATNGLQSLVCFILPVLGAMFAVIFLDADIKLISKPAMWALAAVLAVGVFTLVGLKLTDKVTGGVTAGYQDAYSTYSDMGEWTGNFLRLFTNWFSLLGVSVAKNDPLMSEASIVNILRIFLAIFLLIAPVVALCGYKSIRSRGVKMLLIGHFAVSVFIVFASVFGSLGNADWRLTPMLGTAVISTFAYAVDLVSRKKVAARVGALMLAFLIFASVLSAAEIKGMKKGDQDRYDAHLITERLEEKGLEHGYATFWYSQIVTMLSEEQVKCRVIADGASTPIKRDYQSRDSWYEDVPGEDRYFLLLTAGENDAMRIWLKANIYRETERFEIKNETTGATYYVYVYSENFVTK